MAEVISSSFIPKKEFIKKSAPKKKFSVNIFFLIALILFLSTIIGSIWVFLWRQNLIKNNEIMKKKFVDGIEQYGVETIRQFSIISGRIENSRKLLENHHNILPIFNFLERNTLADIYYTDLKIQEKSNETSGDSYISISAKGVASDLPDLSLQSDAYGENPNVSDLVISNITRSKKGLVVFDLDFRIKKRFLTTQTFSADDIEDTNQDFENNTTESAEENTE